MHVQVSVELVRRYPGIEDMIPSSGKSSGRSPLSFSSLSIVGLEPDQDRSERGGVQMIRQMSVGSPKGSPVKQGGTMQEQVGRDEVSKVKYKLIAGEAFLVHRTMPAAHQGFPFSL